MTLTPYSDVHYSGACLSENQGQVLQTLRTPSVVLKDGRTSKIWRCPVNNLVVKQFKARSQSNLLSRLRSSRAERAAKHALTLIDKGFLTPKVFAYLRDRSPGNSSYLVTADMAGAPLEERLLSKDLDPQIILSWLARLHNAEIYHRDLKRSNLYIHCDEVGVIDLDSLKVKPFWPLEAAGKDLGMLLSSAGGFFSDEKLRDLLTLYQQERRLSDQDREQLLRRAIAVARRRFERGSTPKVGGWPRA